MSSKVIIKINSAATVTDAVITEDGVTLRENPDYRYLSAFSECAEDGSYIAMCSKDLKEWVVCVGAVGTDGIPLNVKEIAEMIQKVEA